MIRHLIKLIWNKKRSHTLLIIEILASFLVLFGVMSLVTYNMGNYLKPIGFEYERVWTINFDNNQDTTDVAGKIDLLYRKVAGYSEVESATRMSGNSPFSFSNSNTGIAYNKTKSMADIYNTDEHFARTLGLNLIQGKWYGKEDRVAKNTPVVINRATRDALFGTENPVGKTFDSDNDDKWKIVGVVDYFKGKGEYTADSPAIFVLMDGKSGWEKTVLAKVKPGTDANFEARMIKELGAMAKDWTVEVTYMSDQRVNQHNFSLVPMIIFLIISVFLLINVAMGLFGILNLNIARRREEIGVRRALGATEGSIKSQFVGEMWVIAAFGVFIGLLFAVQFPIMSIFDLDPVIYIISILVSVFIIFLIVTLCSYYPSRQAAKIQPAMALHEE